MSQTITVTTSGESAGFTAVQNYTYNSLNRIKDATETVSVSQTWKQTFNYDRYGNRNFDAANTTTIAGCPANQCNPTINAANNRFNSGQGFNGLAQPFIQTYKYDSLYRLAVVAENVPFYLLLSNLRADNFFQIVLARVISSEENPKLLSRIFLSVSFKISSMDLLSLIILSIAGSKSLLFSLYGRRILAASLGISSSTPPP